VFRVCIYTHHPCRQTLPYAYQDSNIHNHRKTCNQRSRGLYKGCSEAKVKVGKRGKRGLKTIEKQRSNGG